MLLLASYMPPIGLGATQRPFIHTVQQFSEAPGGSCCPFGRGSEPWPSCSCRKLVRSGISSPHALLDPPPSRPALGRDQGPHFELTEGLAAASR